MAYRPTNDIRENVIHRNTIFDGQGMVSCCTCGYCIKKTEDATLTLTNFKAADPLINEQSIGSTIIEFSDYMIPSGSFDYVLTPYDGEYNQSRNNDEKKVKFGYQKVTAVDSTKQFDNRFSKSLVYFPFLKCTGETAPQLLNQPLPQVYYPFGSYLYNDFVNAYSGETFWPNSGINENYQFVNNIKIYDSSFYYFISNFYYGFGFGPIYSYTPNEFIHPLTIFYSLGVDSFPNVSFSGDDAILYTEVSGELKSCLYRYALSSLTGDNPQNIYCKWGNGFLRDQIINIKRRTAFDFLGNFAFDYGDFLNNGPRSEGFINSLFWYHKSAIPYIRANSSVSIPESSSTIVRDGYLWAVPSGINPCSEVTISTVYANYPDPLIPKQRPTNQPNSGFQEYIDYVSSNDYSVEGFKSVSPCTNGIQKVFDPKYTLDVDEYNFSYLHQNYNLTKKQFGITSNLGIGSDTSIESVTPLVKIDGAKDLIRNGYVLDRFKINSDGSFFSTISCVLESDYISTFYQEKWQLSEYPFGLASYNCTLTLYQWESTSFFPYYHDPNYYISNVYYDTPSLNFNQKIVKGDAYEFIDYTNGVSNGSYINGTFACYSTKPMFVYDNGVFGRIKSSEALSIPVSYVSQRTNKTQMSSTTDATGKTTVTIKNVLWVGKTLLTNTYTHNSGANRPNLAYEKVPLKYDAILKGGFESDIIVSFQSKPLCKITEIADRLKRLNTLKFTFENYRKIPQENFIQNDLLENIINETPLAPEKYINFSPNVGVYVQGYPTDPVDINYSKTVFDNIAFAPPNVNQEGTVIVSNSKTQVSGEKVKWNLVKDIVAIDPPVLTSYVAKSGRVYPDFGVPDRFKSCLLINGDPDVWKTGNEVQFVGLDYLVTNGGAGYTSVPTVTLSNGGGTGASANATISGGKVVSVNVRTKGINYTSNKTVVISGGGGSGATAVDISFTPFYSIYMEEIKDEKQTAGQSLIRIATTLENANNGIYIPNVGLETLYKDKSLSVKFLYGFKDLGLTNAPKYKDFDPNSLDFSNPNADSRGISYNLLGPELKFEDAEISIFTNYYNQYDDFLVSWSNPNAPYYGSSFYEPTSIRNYNDLKKPDYEKIEIISLSPLKIKYIGSKFKYFWSGANPRLYPIINLTTGKVTSIYWGNNSPTGFGFDTTPYIYIPPPYSYSNIPAPFGIQAKASATIFGTSVVSIEMTNQGSEYNYNNAFGLYYSNTKSYQNKFYEINNSSTIYPVPIVSFIYGVAGLVYNANYGFMCDMVVEEVVDEFIESALPVEFNEILENVEYIQTSNLMNSRKPMEMINLENCEHIGKVIDRKDCNCPKKWVRLCDVHGKTDWKKCMQCKDFKVSE
jgi:hypothetical protein